MSTGKCRVLVAIVGLGICAVAGGADEAPPAKAGKESTAVAKTRRTISTDRSPQELAELDRYQRLHWRLRSPSYKWDATVEELIESGDAFTLHVMKRPHSKDEDRGITEQRKRVIEGIEKRRGKNPDQIRVEEVSFLVEHAVFIHHNVCSPMQPIMLRWLVGKLRSQLDDPGMRERLIELEAELKSEPVIVHSFPDGEELWVSPTEQLRREVAKLLHRKEKR